MKVLNDLYDYENYKIYQDDKTFKFSLDSILLAEFVVLKKNDKVLELCTGNGACSLILSYYYSNEIVGFEIQENIYKLALESILYNKKDKQIRIINDNIINIKKYFPGNIFDVILCNPPYFKYSDNSLINKNRSLAIARHEIEINLEEIFKIVAYALKSNGFFYISHIPERLEEIFYLCEKYQIIAKSVQFIYTKREKNANIVLIKCIKGAKNSLNVAKPIYLENIKTYKNILRR